MIANQRNLNRRSLSNILHIDLPLLGGLAVLISFGLVILYSASGQEMDTVMRQGTRMLLALGVMIAMAQISPDTLRWWTPWIYGTGVVLLIVVLVAGDIGKGAQRWLDLGVIRFQPSEMMKIAVPMMVAWYLSEIVLPPSFKHIVVAFAITLVPALLIAKQPDLGTAVLITSAGIFVLLFAGLSFRLITYGALAALPLGYLLWTFGMHDYQRQRVLTFLDPGRDPLGSGYHIIQSEIAIGSGGVYGKGWLYGTQSHLDFLPERHTDFIFAVFGEEFGLFGAILLLAIYAFIVYRGIFIAVNGQDTFARLAAGALTMTFLIYIFINIGMVSGLLPVVGVPLPLISYGGSSMVTLLASFGILMSVHTHRRLLRT